MAGGKDKLQLEKETNFLLCTCSSESDSTYAFGTYNRKFLKTPKLFQSILNSGVREDSLTIFSVIFQP